jgi:hypothetical protein
MNEPVSVLVMIFIGHSLSLQCVNLRNIFALHDIALYDIGRENKNTGQCEWNAESMSLWSADGRSGVSATASKRSRGGNIT